jgi:hypothetical protein
MNTSIGRELDALGEGADDQAAGDRREGALEDDVGVLGDDHTLREGCHHRIGTRQ